MLPRDVKEKGCDSLGWCVQNFHKKTRWGQSPLPCLKALTSHSSLRSGIFLAFPSPLLIQCCHTIILFIFISWLQLYINFPIHHLPYPSLPPFSHTILFSTMKLPLPALFAAPLAFLFAVAVADPDLLQDVCVADLASGTYFKCSSSVLSSS